MIDIGGVEYTTKEKELWSDTIPDSNRIYIKKSDTHLYGDSYKFPAEVFIGLTNGNNQEFTFLMTLIPEYPPVKFSILSAITFSSLLQ